MVIDLDESGEFYTINIDDLKALLASVLLTVDNEKTFKVDLAHVNVTEYEAPDPLDLQKQIDELQAKLNTAVKINQAVFKKVPALPVVQETTPQIIN